MAGQAVQLCLPVGAQDAHALTSWQRATEAAAQGWTADEITPVEVPGSKGGAPKLVTQVCVSHLAACWYRRRHGL